MMKPFSLILLSIFSLSLFSACASEVSDSSDQQSNPETQTENTNKRQERLSASTTPYSISSESGEYLIQITPENGKYFPFNEYFSMQIHISQPLKSVQHKLKLAVDAGMRAHNHGMHSRPKVTNIKNGDFLVEGMLFHMPGDWQIQFDIERGVMRDSAELEVDVTAAPPEFSDSEQAIIRSLSFHNKPQKKDDTNRYSGDPGAIAFGRKLFFSKKLSGDGLFSCASCHQPQHHWGDAKAISHIRDTPLQRHTPTLWNVAESRWLQWDGRADTLWLQATKPLESEQELASSRLQITHLIKTNTELRQEYEQIFGQLPTTLSQADLPENGRPVPDNPQHPHHANWQKLNTKQQKNVNRLFVNVAKAIAAFEETIVSRNSAFDRFAQTLEKKSDSTNHTQHTHHAHMGTSNYPNAAIRGLRLFIGKARCIHCHSGPNFSDSEFHSIFFDNEIAGEQPGGDPGRYAAINALLHDPFNSNSLFSDITSDKNNKLDFLYRNIELKYKFKTPTLRNITQTAPYMHDGQMHDLKTVIQYYNTISEQKALGDHQEVLLQSLQLSDSEQYDLISFLNTLNDDQFLKTLDAHEKQIH